MTASDGAAQHFDAVMQSAWQGSMLQLSHLNDAMPNNAPNAFSYDFTNINNANGGNIDMWSSGYLQAASDAMMQQHAAARFDQNGAQQQQQFKGGPDMQALPPQNMQNMHWSQLSASPQHLSHVWPSNQQETVASENKAAMRAGSSNHDRLPTQARPISTNQRSQTESLWQRRLNAKNRELEQIHQHMSAPEELPQSISPQSQQNRWQESDDVTTSVSEHDSETTFTSTSKSTPQMAEFQMSVGAPDMSSCLEHQYSAWEAPSRHASATHFAGQQLSPLVTSHNISTVIKKETHPSTSSPRSRPKRSSKSRRLSGPAESDLTAQDPDAITARAQDRPAPRSRSHSNSSRRSDGTGHHIAGNTGKGSIDKVIVPSAPGAEPDAVDVRTGESGQMRHVCPAQGCDKHFSTSGHARRHSRVHDCLRPFVCPHEECHATFTRRDNCTQHQRARHKFQLVAHRQDEGNAK